MNKTLMININDDDVNERRLYDHQNDDHNS